MRRVGLVALAALASCGPNSAIELVVELPDNPPAPIDEVRIYVGLGYAQNKDGDAEMLIPRGYGPNETESGFYWKRAVPEDPAMDRVTMTAGTTEVRFVFQPDDNHDRIAVIAVASSDGKVQLAGAIPEMILESGTVRQYPLLLKPAGPAKSQSAITVSEWGPGDAARQFECAHYKEGDKSIYVVTKGNRDCDEFRDDDEAVDECRPDVFRGYRRAKREAHACLRMEVLVASPIQPSMSLTLGSVADPNAPETGCTEQMAPANLACPAFGVGCVEPEVMSCLSRTPGAQTLDCIAADTMTPGGSRIDCQFFLTKDGGSGDNNFCPGGADMPLTAPFPRLTNIECHETEDYHFWIAGSGKWQHGTFTKGPSTFTAILPTKQCHFALNATGLGPLQVNSGQLFLTGVVEGPLANGRTVAFPINITLNDAAGLGGCGLPATTNKCRFIGTGGFTSDAFRSCVMAPIVEPW